MYQKKREHRARESTEYGILCTCTCSSATSSREARDSGVDMGIGRFIGVFWLGAWYGVATKFHRHVKRSRESGPNRGGDVFSSCLGRECNLVGGSELVV